jgi:hypothetical protein
MILSYDGDSSHMKNIYMQTFLPTSKALTIVSVPPCTFLGGGLSPLGTSATIWPIVPGPGDDDECGTVGGMVGKGNQSTWRKPVPVPPQIPYDLIQAQT